MNLEHVGEAEAHAETEASNALLLPGYIEGVVEAGVRVRVCPLAPLQGVQDVEQLIVVDWFTVARRHPDCYADTALAHLTPFDYKVDAAHVMSVMIPFTTLNDFPSRAYVPVTPYS